MAHDIVGKVGEILHAHKHIERDELQPGQNIFVYRAGGTYSHHGIYVEKDRDNVQYVIHFLRTKISLRLHEHPPCPRCGYRKKKDIGIVKTCLDCFMKKGNKFAGKIIYLYHYSKTVTYPPEKVVKTASEKLQNNLIFHYCEDFATYCSTGSEKSKQVHLYNCLPGLQALEMNIQADICSCN